MRLVSCLHLHSQMLQLFLVFLVLQVYTVSCEEPTTVPPDHITVDYADFEVLFHAEYYESKYYEYDTEEKPNPIHRPHSGSSGDHADTSQRLDEILQDDGNHLSATPGLQGNKKESGLPQFKQEHSLLQNSAPSTYPSVFNITALLLFFLICLVLHQDLPGPRSIGRTQVREDKEAGEIQQDQYFPKSNFMSIRQPRSV